MMRADDYLDGLLERDRESEIPVMDNFTEDDYTFLREQQELMEEFR